MMNMMPNKHPIPFNLEPFSMANTNEIFVATNAPFGCSISTVIQEE